MAALISETLAVRCATEADIDALIRLKPSPAVHRDRLRDAAIIVSSRAPQQMVTPALGQRIKTIQRAGTAVNLLVHAVAPLGYIG